MSLSLPDKVSEKEIKKAESRFLIFFGVSVGLFVLLVVSILCNYPKNFWQTNTIWSIGSFLVGVSIFYSRFFNVKNTVSKENYIVERELRRSYILVLEQILNLLWIIGFFLIILSRWVNY